MGRRPPHRPARSDPGERLDLAAAKGCDAVDPDNVDGYANPTGFDLTGDDQLAFNRWLAEGRSRAASGWP